MQREILASLQIDEKTTDNFGLLKTQLKQFIEGTKAEKRTNKNYLIDAPILDDDFTNYIISIFIK